MMRLVCDDEVQLGDPAQVADKRLHHRECRLAAERFFIGRPEADRGFGIDCAILGAVLLDELVTVLQDQCFSVYGLADGRQTDGLARARGGHGQGVAVVRQSFYRPIDEPFLVRAQEHG